MRTFLAVAVALGLVTPALAETNKNLMDMVLGQWTLTSDIGASCTLTLSDAKAGDGQALQDTTDCPPVDPVMKQAAAWRIDEPNEFVFLTAKGKVLATLSYDVDSGTFHTAADRNPPLNLEPSE